jgi:hypothetical protein
MQEASGVDVTDYSKWFAQLPFADLDTDHRPHSSTGISNHPGFPAISLQSIDSFRVPDGRQLLAASSRLLSRG